MQACKKWILSVFCILLINNGTSQAPFSRGVNLTGWFQVNSPGKIQYTRFTLNDLLNIKSLGCDVIRLPVNLHSMTSGEPHFIIDPLFFTFLDSVVDWCEQLNLYLIIDNHSFDPDINTSPDVANILVKAWSQMASHYKDRSEYILYEVLNEPHGISTNAWATIQNQVINAIRAIDNKHTIVVGGSNYNSYTELKNLPQYSDPNLLYTFHFYDPFIFTHQGASWVNPSMVPLSGVPFPYSASEMPACPPSLKGTWIESNINSYPSHGTAAYIKSLIDIAINFRNSRNVNIFCGEFGVYIPNSPPGDRIVWYDVVRQYLEENDIPWTIWDYKGGFGLFNKNSNSLFEHDLNTSLLGSLGMNIPEQTPYIRRPDSTGFMIYTDFTGEKISDASHTTGSIDFYSSMLPNNDKYCLFWNGFSQYNALLFDFIPDRDLSQLVSEGSAIDFMVRGNKPGIKFDIRFRDTDTDSPADHPWRMGTTIDGNMVLWDKRWHHVHIPLAALAESGSWDDNSWFNPEGKFDWSDVDCFEISMESSATSGQQLWFDNIHITNLDTATVRESGTVGVRDVNTETPAGLVVMPNPMKEYAEIVYDLPGESRVSINIYSLSGRMIRCLADGIQPPGKMTLIWDGFSNNGTPVPQGLYLVRVKTRFFTVTGRIIRN